MNCPKIKAMIKAMIMYMQYLILFFDLDPTASKRSSLRINCKLNTL